MPVVGLYDSVMDLHIHHMASVFLTLSALAWSANLVYFGKSGSWQHHVESLRIPETG